MNIKKRIEELEQHIITNDSPFVAVSLADGKHGLMLWSDAVIAAIDDRIVKVETDSTLAELVRIMMIK